MLIINNPYAIGVTSKVFDTQSLFDPNGQGLYISAYNGNRTVRSGVLLPVESGEVVFTGYDQTGLNNTVVVRFNEDGQDRYLVFGNLTTISNDLYVGKTLNQTDTIGVQGRSKKLYFEVVKNFTPNNQGFNGYGGSERFAFVEDTNNVISAGETFTSLNGVEANTLTIHRSSYFKSGVSDVYSLRNGRTSQGDFDGHLRQTDILVSDFDLDNDGDTDKLFRNQNGHVYLDGSHIGHWSVQNFDFVDVLKSWNGNHKIVFQNKNSGTLWVQSTFNTGGSNLVDAVGSVPTSARIASADITGYGVEGLVIQYDNGQTLFKHDGTNQNNWYLYHRRDTFVGSFNMGGDSNKSDLIYVNEDTGQVNVSIDGNRNSYFQVGDMAPGERLIAWGVDLNGDGRESLISQNTQGNYYDWVGGYQSNGEHLGKLASSWDVSFAA